MIISTGMIYALILIFVFIGSITVLDRFDLLERVGMELSGPFLMWKTKKGRDLIERISKKKRFWEMYGNIGLVIVAIAMIFIFLLVGWNAYVATSIPAEQAPEANEILVIPGVNPFIPVGYGILSLAVGIIVHEFSHGILSRVADVDIKSLGLIFLVVPLGAFVEPDEDQIEETERIKRDRMFAAGATSNIILAIVLLLIFSMAFMGSVSAKEDGPMITAIGDDSPAEDTEMQTYEQIIEIEDEKITSNTELQSLDTDPMEILEVKTLRGDEKHTYNLTSGLAITALLEGHPADEAGMEKGDIFYSINGEMVRNWDGFSSTLEEMDQDETLDITFYSNGESGYVEENATLTLEEGKMGINVGYFGVATQEADWIIQLLSSPLSSAETASEALQNAAGYIALPLLGLSPLPEQIAQQYEISGPLSIMPTSSFWVVANSIYWIFWLNILLGLFNALPAVPLDGGHLFNDLMESLAEKLGMDEESGEKLSVGMTYAVALLILFLLMWSIIGPRI